MTDIATMVERTLQSTIDALFEDVTTKKMYVTGGLGADGRTEAFGAEYVLPNRAYAETCAAVGGMLWYHRYFLRTGKAAAYDALERTLYNGYLSGVSLAGNTFFYQNPLMSDGRVERSSYFDVACCPANLARLMAQLPGLIYAQQGDRLYVNLFIGSAASITVGGAKATITQQTDYPWNGAIAIHVDPERPVTSTVSVRIPSWALANEPPGALYRYSASIDARPAVKVNGTTVPLDIIDGYVSIRRRWRKGDAIAVDLPMPVRRVLANDKVAEDVGKSAIQRGPILYALEGVDNGGSLKDLKLPLDAPLMAAFKPDLLNGVEVVTATVAGQTVTAVPYYAWNNRGKGDMEVWIPY
jgi:hypothetical protein